MTVRAPSWRLVTLSSTCPPRPRRFVPALAGIQPFPADSAQAMPPTRPVGGGGETVRVKGRLARTGDQPGDPRRPGHRELSGERGAMRLEVALEVDLSLDVDLGLAS